MRIRKILRSLVLQKSSTGHSAAEPASDSTVLHSYCSRTVLPVEYATVRIRSTVQYEHVQYVVSGKVVNQCVIVSKGGAQSY